MGRRSEHTRDEIQAMALAAARRIVVKHGAEGLSTRKIAADIGYTVGSLYLVFRNLRDLTLRLNAETLDEMYAALESADRANKDGEAALLAVAHAYIRFAFEHRPRWALVFERVRGKAPVWFQEKVARMFGLVEGRLAQLAPGHSQTEIARAARALWSGVHGISVLALAEHIDKRGVASAQTLADSLVGHYLIGFTGATRGRRTKTQKR